MQPDNPKLEEILNDLVRPQLMLHGGDIETVSVAEGVFRFRLLGQCAGCPSAALTTENLVAQAVMQALPEIKQVVLVQGVSEHLLQQAKALLKKDKV